MLAILHFIYTLAKSAVIAYLAITLMSANSNFLQSKNKQFGHFVDLLGAIVYFAMLIFAVLWFGGRL